MKANMIHTHEDKNMRCFFASDLHGRIEQYQKLFNKILGEQPDAVFLGGDLLPNLAVSTYAEGIWLGDFVQEIMAEGFLKIKAMMAEKYPRVFLILGNDDPRAVEETIWEGQLRGAWDYVHNRRVQWGAYPIYGYACVPPTPFLLKDWERYDVSRFVDLGCISPEEGWRSVKLPESERKFATIQTDLEELTEAEDVSKAIFLMHSPPYQTNLDRANLDGQMVNGIPMDVHVGSIAIRKFIELRQPCITLHGHIHESSRLSGSWQDRIGRTLMFSAGYEGNELALVSFDLRVPERAKRELV